MRDETQRGRPAGAQAALGEAARNARAAGDQLEEMLELLRVVRQARRARRAERPAAGDAER